MSIQQEIILRYKSSGHVRFQLPERLCTQQAAEVLLNGIDQIDGVYRARLFKNNHKLSIRYVEESLPFTELAQQLLNLIVKLEKKGYFKSNLPPSITPSKSIKTGFKLPDWKSTRWAKEKYTETKETAQAIGVLAKLGMKKKPEILTNPEKSLITFFNDVLILYLIKIHWNLITKKWMVSPYKYRYPWLAIFYLMYLFIRSRTHKSK